MARASRLVAAPLLILLLASAPPVSPSPFSPSLHSPLPLPSSPSPAARAHDRQALHLRGGTDSPGHNRPCRSWSGELAAFPECSTAADLDSPAEITVSVPVGVKGRRRTLKIALEGNIAAGKSTLLKLLEDDVDYVAVPEPLSKWQQVTGEEDGEASGATGCQGGNLLDLFYKDPKRWGYTFQTYAFLSRMMAQLQSPQAQLEGRQSRASIEANSSSVVFYERSVFSDRYIFAENCAETGLFNKVEWGIYQDWHAWLLGAFEDLKLDGIVYLRTTPDTCLHRLKKRARSEEAGVPLDYLQQIHGRHERWLKDRPADFVPAPQVANTPVLTLDCDTDMVLHPEMKDQLREQVRAFIATLHQQGEAVEGGEGAALGASGRLPEETAQARWVPRVANPLTLVAADGTPAVERAVVEKWVEEWKTLSGGRA
mmetsp:Transcript_26899/g.62419  ORF Transcript_26899/g.62419 Transcript_26899/m.62419 type:complete len:427 (+) Transcript_26899:1-1281(+)